MDKPLSKTGLVIALTGNLQTDPVAISKYGDLVENIRQKFSQVDVINAKAMEEIIEHEKTGLLVPPEDIDALANALLQLFGDQEKRINFGRMARQRVEERYTWQHTVALIAPILEQAAQKN